MSSVGAVQMLSSTHGSSSTQLVEQPVSRARSAAFMCQWKRSTNPLAWGWYDVVRCKSFATDIYSVVWCVEPLYSWSCSTKRFAFVIVFDNIQHKKLKSNDHPYLEEEVYGQAFLQVNGMKKESMVTIKCPEIMCMASQTQNELNSRWCRWWKKKQNKCIRNFRMSFAIFVWFWVEPRGVWKPLWLKKINLNGFSNQSIAASEIVKCCWARDWVL